MKGWVGGWVNGKVEEEMRERMSYCGLLGGGGGEEKNERIGGWVGEGAVPFKEALSSSTSVICSVLMI